MKTRMTLAVVAAMILAACGDMPHPGSQSEREVLHAKTQAVLSDFKAADPTLQPLIDKAHAYAIFPQVVSAAIGLGGAHGDGEVYQNGRLIGYTDLSQGSNPAQLGGQKFAELILFERESSLVDFQHGTVEFDARATAVAASKGAASTANYQRGVMVFTLPQGGLMAQAAIGGQKFRYVPVGQQ